MGWTFSDKKTLPVVKENGRCLKRSMWKYCPYFVAKHSSPTSVLGFRCILFNSDKEADVSIAECNAKYGSNYDGLP